MSVSQSFEYLERLRDFFYGMLELRDRLKERGFVINNTMDLLMQWLLRL